MLLTNTLIKNNLPESSAYNNPTLFSTALQLAETWNKLLNIRDLETEEHTKRVVQLSKRLADRLGYSNDAIEKIHLGALLHDIGKIGIPDAILLKPGPLNDEEWVMMRQHPVIAYDLMNSSNLLQPYTEIPLFHHERWDGTGYPFGLEKDAIPINARIFSIIDAWDALTSDRPYHRAKSPRLALNTIIQGTGHHFDPAIVDAFVKLAQEELMQIKTTQTILIVDDETNILIGLEEVLNREGFDVETASNGKEGLYKAIQIEPNLIICDIMMPKMNGFELKKNISYISKLANTPFIFLTARTSKLDRIDGFNLGADDYITKPFDVDVFVAKIKAVLDRQASVHIREEIKNKEQIAALRDSITSVMSHELRTPLGIVLNTLELALEEKFSRQSEDLQWYLKTALNNTQKLRYLINDLLFLHSSDQGKVNTFRQLVDVDNNLLKCLPSLSEYWKHKNIHLELIKDSQIIIHAPRESLELAFFHLVDNAYKFSPKGSEIVVQIKKNGIGGCNIRVSDEGPGIEPIFRKKVFERYFQISSGDTRNYSGLGVGLTIARIFARNMGGEVNILDTEKGCLIEMVIPPAPLEFDQDV